MRTITCLRKFLSASLLRTRNDSIPGLITRRFASTSPVVVQEITRKVKQYGKLVVDVPWNVEVKPTDPHAYPDMDTIIVKLFVSNNRNENTEFLSIDINDNRCKITASKEVDYPSEGQCLIESPIQYDVEARTIGDASIKISSMVSDVIHAETERGNISGGKLQAKKIILHSRQGGSVDLKHSLQGNIEIKTSENGSITAEKCLGTNLEMTTENGDVCVGSNYCEQATFATVNGNLKLNNLHMDSTVDVSGKGSLNVSCLDGSMQARLRDGETKVQLVRLTGKSRIVSGGPVHLIVPRENNVQLSLRGRKLSLDEGLSGKKWDSEDEQQVFESNGEIPLHVETSDDLRVTSASWAESLQLGNFMK